MPNTANIGFPATSRQASGTYYAQLDGVRALAVIGVMLHHWTRPFNRLDFGGLGVRLFFVLSGFLITGILLRCRSAEHAGVKITEHLKQFYIRRFLRIFPLYYLYLTLIVIFVPTIRAHVWWHFAYLTNFYAAQSNAYPHFIGHCWTLSVEEQFYLLWPMLILTIPRAFLKGFILGTVLSGVVSRVVIGCVLGPSAVAIVTLPMANLDSLGLGALLALLIAGEGVSQRISRLSFWIGLPALLVLHFPPTVHVSKGLHAVLEPLSDAVFSFWLVDFARRGTTTPLGRVFAWRPLRYLGSISYGMYVWHYSVGPIVDSQLGPSSGTMNTAVHFCLNFALTVTIAAISWHVFERPINQLKRFFPYASLARHQPLR